MSAPAIEKSFGARSIQAAQQGSNAAADILVTILATTLDIAFLGTQEALVEMARSNQSCAGESLALTSKLSIQMFNPAAEVKNWDMLKSEDQPVPSKRQYLNRSYALKNTELRVDYAKMFGQGRIRLKDIPGHLKAMADFQQTKLNSFYESNSFFKKQIGTRLVGLISGIAYAIIGIVLVIFGAFATLAAICTMGRYEKINSTAYNNLRVVSFAFNQLHQGVIGFFRPSHICHVPTTPAK